LKIGLVFQSNGIQEWMPFFFTPMYGACPAQSGSQKFFAVVGVPKSLQESISLSVISANANFWVTNNFDNFNILLTIGRLRARLLMASGLYCLQQAGLPGVRQAS